jgi:hypothetical protein
MWKLIEEIKKTVVFLGNISDENKITLEQLGSSSVYKAYYI